jgi:hypothetical protein
VLQIILGEFEFDRKTVALGHSTNFIDLYAELNREKI